MKLRKTNAYSFKDLVARINKLFVCCLKTSKKFRTISNCCSKDLIIKKINSYGDVTVDKTVLNRITTAIHDLTKLSGLSITYLNSKDTIHTRYKYFEG